MNHRLTRWCSVCHFFLYSLLITHIYTHTQVNQIERERGWLWSFSLVHSTLSSFHLLLFELSRAFVNLLLLLLLSHTSHRGLLSLCNLQGSHLVKQKSVNNEAIDCLHLVFRAPHCFTVSTCTRFFQFIHHCTHIKGKSDE